MTGEPKIVHAERGGELDRVLDAAVSGQDIVIERGPARFRLRRELPLPSHDRTEVEYQRALDEAIGSWADLDADSLVQDIYERRRDGSRGPVSD